MIILGSIIAINIMALTILLLVKKHRPEIVLLSMGLMMTLIAYFLGIKDIGTESGNFGLFSIFEECINLFKDKIAGVGLTIMLLCGYVGYMCEIKASDALSYVLIQPASVLRKHPYFVLGIMITLGILLSLAIPSATGVAMLISATLYPVLLRLGLSKLTALSAISACTILDFGVNSPCTRIASSILNMDISSYVGIQYKVIIPLILVITVTYIAYSIHCDRKAPVPADNSGTASGNNPEDFNHDGKVPLYYSVLPLLPLIISVTFSSAFGFRITEDESLDISLDASILFSFFISALIEMSHTKSIRKTSAKMKSFWDYMGHTMSSVVVLLFAAGIFADGLMNLGINDALARLTMSMDLGKTGLTVLLSFVVFLTVVLTGSGTAAFTAYSNIIPDMAMAFGYDQLFLMLPVQMIAGIARTVSPIAIVIIVLSHIGDVNPIELVKRNAFPVAVITVATFILSILSI